MSGGDKTTDSEQAAIDVHASLLLPLRYSCQLAESQKKKVLSQMQGLQFPNKKVEEIRSEWEDIVKQYFTTAKSELVSEIQSSKIAEVDPRLNRECESIFREDQDCGNDDKNVEACLRQFNAKFEIERKKHLLKTLRNLNEALTRKCDAYEKKIRKEHEDICKLYDSLKHDQKRQ